jgi:hypothetical protein
VTDLTVAKTILAQLGGERFVMMTGATSFYPLPSSRLSKK